MEYPSSKQQVPQQQQQPNSAVVAAATRTFVVRCSSSDSSQSQSQQRNSDADRRMLLVSLIVVMVGIFMAFLLPSKKWFLAIDFIRNNISNNNNDNKKSMNWSEGNIPFFFLLFIGIALLMTCTFFSTRKRCKDLEYVVSVYPLGVQLSTRRHDDDNNNNITQRKKLQQPSPPLCFIPREDIIDVIVSEVVLSYKVVSVLLFRTRRRQDSQPQLSLSPSSINNLVTGKSSIADFTLEQRRTKVQLIPVFPVDNMTYQQCLTMRDQISQCLGLP